MDFLEETQGKRMAGDYEIFCAIHVGDRENVLGSNPADRNGMKYMCAVCQNNALYALYSHLMGSDDFLEIVELFGERISEQARKTRTVMEKPKTLVEDDRPLLEADCIPVTYSDDLHNKIVVIRSDILYPEYQRATCQLKICKGGFGASPNSRGNACYCIDLYTGKEARYERSDILGILEPERLPDWAKHKLKNLQKETAAKRKELER